MQSLRKTLIVFVFLSQALAFFIGGCYYNLPTTSAGAFTRGSVLFIALLVSSLDAFVEVCGSLNVHTLAQC
jgi:ATP-binding cassette subfamily G (WHITE) protein 2 (SNQ2)